MIAEPVAAARAFGWSPAYTQEEANVLVYDLGQAIFVSILTIENSWLKSRLK